jgi:WD40 repeat protein/tetratricopeptide (TPR) repeat protein
MSETPSHGSPPSDDNPAVQELLVDQQLCWQRGERVPVEDYLTRQPHLQSDSEAVLDLITHEVMLRRQAGENPQLDEFQRRFPHLAEELACQFEVESAIEGETQLYPNNLSPPTVMATDRDSLPELLPPPDVAGYEILAELGRGSMGVVYKARHRQLNRLVALKMILSGGFASPQERVRFLAEAETIAAIEHPGIVRVHEFGTHNGLPFFSLEFCAGGSLARRLAETPLPAREAARLIEQVARAVQAAHDRGIVHRDLKPGNILLAHGQSRPNGTDGTDGTDKAHRSHPSHPSHLEIPKVTDFGLAKRVECSGLTTTGAVVGTPSYMAPEQALGSKDVDRTADVYALGAILYDCLTGRPPFKAARVYDTLMQVVSDDPVPPRQLNPAIPRDLETICLKCLHKRPGQRYASAANLADELGRWQRGEPVLARPVGMSERAVKWARRRPTVAGLLAGIVLLTVIAIAVISGLYRDAASEARRAQQAEQQAEQDRDKAREQEGIARQAEEKAREKEGLARTEKVRAEKQLERAERLLYASHIQAAHREWEAGNAATAWQHLESCRQDYRNVEYRYLLTLFNRNHVTLLGHTDAVSSVAISPDGKHVVSGSRDHSVKVWDTLTGKNLLTLKGHTGEVTSVAISPDSKWIISGSEDHKVKVWDRRSGKELRTLDGHSGGVNSVAISPDGKRIISANTDHTVKMWDASSGKELLTLDGHTLGASSVAISPDGKRIVSGGQDNLVKVWDAATGKNLLTLAGHVHEVKGLAYSPDGKWIVSAGWDHMVKVWDAVSGKELRTFKGHTSGVHGVAISGDARRIVSAGEDHTIKVWDAASGTELLTLRGHVLAVNSVAFSDDGKHIVSGSWDATVKVWDTASDKNLLTLAGHALSVRGVAFSPDGKRIVSASWDNTAKLWDAATGQELLTLNGHTNGVHAVTFSPDGKRIASGSTDHTVKVWDAATGRNLLTLKGHTGAVYGVAYSPDSKRIVSGSHDRTVKIWDATSGKEPLTLAGHADVVRGVVFSPDGKRIVSGSTDHTVRVWDASSGKELRTLTGHTSWVTTVALDGDGKRIVSAGHDNTPKVWDADTGKNLLTLEGHARYVTSLAFSSDGKRIISGSGDHMVKVWDAASGKELLTLRGHATEVTAVALSGDGSRIVSGSGDMTMKVWDATAGKELLDLVRANRSDQEKERELREARNCKFLRALNRFDPAWHRQQLDEALAAHDDFAAAYHLERLTHGAPWDAPMHILCAHVQAWLGKRQEAAAHLAQALLLNPSVSLWPTDSRAAQRAELSARAGNWSLAVRDFQIAAHQPEASARLLIGALLAQLAMPNESGARQTIREMVQRLTREKDSQTSAALCFCTQFAPWDKTSGEVLLTRARGELARQRNSVTLHRHGVALYRMGRYEEAERALAESIGAHGNGGFFDTLLFGAMTARQRGKHEQAAQLLARFEKWHEKETFAQWQDRVAWSALLNEARKVIHTPPPMPKAEQ